MFIPSALEITTPFAIAWRSEFSFHTNYRSIIKNLFEHTSASWVRYSDYEWKETKNHQLYLLPAKDAIPSPYDPMKEAESIVLAAIEIGMMLFRTRPETEVRDTMREFSRKYGLLGIMTALPTTAKFIDYEKVYFPYNEIVRTESMETLDYLKLFFRFRCQI